jgi:DNA repair protein RecO (recombination protein O)
MTQWTTQAVVLDTMVMGESDLRVHMLTPGQGRIYATAKAALRSKKRFAGSFDLFEIITAGFMVAPRTGRVIIEHAAPVNQFPRFRESPARLARASLLIETATLAAAEQEPCPEIYATLTQGLIRLHQESDTDRWALTYAYRLLDRAGYKPALDLCTECGEPQESGKTVFSPPAGGVLCRKCRGRERARPTGCEAFGISPDTARTLVEIMALPEDRLPRINFTRNSLAQARKILEFHIAHQLHRPSRSLAFMREF